MSKESQNLLLQGKTALVTGAGQGIGREIALTLAQHGCKVAVNDITSDRATDVAEEITRYGGESISVVYDVAILTDVQKMFHSVVNKFGSLDIVVNNAGIILKNSFWDITEEEWDRIMKVNLKSVFLCCQAAALHMRPQGSGKIINIASIAGKRGGGFLGNTAYAASKAGVIGLTKGLARELGSYKINVNAVTPGYIETDMTKSLSEEKRGMVLGGMSLKRPGTPKDVANAVLYLASPLSDFISGEIMDVDGGLMMD